MGRCVPRSLLLPAVLLLAILAGCSSTYYARLTNEDSVPYLADLKRAAHAPPCREHRVVTTNDGSHPLGIQVCDVGEASHERVIVFLHGMLADHESWRFVAGDLRNDFDLLLVDLPGCGGSEPADVAHAGPDGYAVPKVTRRVLQALRERLAARGDTAPVAIVAHSLGGCYAMRMFCDKEIRKEYADVLDRVDRLILLSPLDIALSYPPPIVLDLLDTPDWQVALGAFSGYVHSRVAEATWDNAVEPLPPLRQEADKRYSIITDRARRHATQALLRGAVPWTEKGPDWDRIDPVVAQYGNCDVRTLILWGVRDQIIPVATGYKLKAQLANAELVTLPLHKHSIHLEHPVECSRYIREFIATGSRPFVPGERSPKDLPRGN